MDDQANTFETNAQHQLLAKMAGQWKGTTSVWFQPAEPVDTASVEGTIKPILGGRFMLHEYKSTFEGKPLEAMAVYGYDMNLKRFQMVWLDTFHNSTAMLFSNGERNAQEASVTGSYTYITPEAETTWGWRTAIEMTDDDEIRITAYNVFPDGKEAKATETIYTRVG